MNEKREYKRLCPNCHKPLNRNGTRDTKNGKLIEWECPHCHKHFSFPKKEDKTPYWLLIYVKVILGLLRIKDLLCCRRTYNRNTSRFVNKKVNLPPVTEHYNVLYIDAVWIKRRYCYMIARTDEKVIAFEKYKTESGASWCEFIRKIPEPKYVVCDGHCGMRIAINRYWNQTKIQFCQAHVKIKTHIDLTKHPKTEAGKKIRALVNLLPHIKTHSNVIRWKNILYKIWNDFRAFFSERTYNGKSWWYTHKNTRRCIKRLIRLYESGELFAWIYETRFVVGRTNNFLEGGINSIIKYALRDHRGANDNRQASIISVLLYSKSYNYNYGELCQLLVL